MSVVLCALFLASAPPVPPAAATETRPVDAARVRAKRPSLAAIVALGRGEAPLQIDGAGAPGAASTLSQPPPVLAPDGAPARTATAPSPMTSSTTATATSATSTPLLLPAAPSPSPWPAIAAVAAIGAGAGVVLWRRRQAMPLRLLVVREQVAVGRGRSLFVVDVAGRRVLLSSSESGVQVVVDLGVAPPEATRGATIEDQGRALPRNEVPDTSFEGVLHGALVPPAGSPGLPMPATATPTATSSTALPTSARLLSSLGESAELEGQELKRRLSSVTLATREKAA